MKTLPYFFVIFFLVFIIPKTEAQVGWMNHPTGGNDDLYGVGMYSSAKWNVVGTNGVIYHTNNSGVNWALQNSGTQMPLNDVDCPSSTVSFAVGDSGIVLKTTNSGATWVRQNSGTFMPIQSVYFRTTSIGYACGWAGNFFSTSNGGTTWNLQNISITANFNDLYFASSTTAYCVGMTGVIYKTTNAGISWQAQTSGVTQDLNEVFFIDTLTGFCAGGGGTLLHTTNGGTTWNQIPSFTPDNLLSLCFPSPSLGYCGTSGGNIFYTIDGGINWMTMPCTPVAINEIIKLSVSSAVASCNMGSVQQSVYLDWNGMAGSGNTDKTFFVNDTVGYALSNLNSNVLKTVDGSTWSVLYSVPPSAYFEDIFFINDTTGYISAGMPTRLYSTVDGGVTWNVDTFPSLYFGQLQFFSKDTGFSQGNVFQRTNDGGQTWTTVGTPTGISDFQFFDLDTGYAFTNSGFCLTMDGGITWTKMLAPSPGTNLYFTNKNVGFVWGASAIYKTTDGARNFHPLVLPSAIVGTIKDVFFTDSLIGYITGGSANPLIYKTKDGGKTWVGQSRQYNVIGTEKLDFPDKNHGYVCTNVGIMKNFNADSIIGNNPAYIPDNFVRQPAPPYAWILQPGDPISFLNIYPYNADYTADKVDRVGNILVAGGFYDKTQFDTFFVDSPLNNYAVFIAKTDPQKNVLWLTPFYGNMNGGFSPRINSISTDAQNNIYVAGMFTDTLNIGSNVLIASNNGYACFVAKLDAAGNVLWAIKYDVNQSSSTKFHAATTDDAGNVYIIGNYELSFTLGSFTLNSNGNCFIGKLDTQGNVIWLTQSTDAQLTNVTSCDISSDGNLVVCGTYNTTCTFGSHSITTADHEDFFLAKFDASNGNTLWLSGASGHNDDIATDVACDRNGNSYVTGSFAEICRFDSSTYLSNVGFPAIFYAKYSASGNLVWAKKIMTGSGSAISLDKSGNCYVTGLITLNSYFADTLINPAGINEIVVFKSDSIGRIRWVKRMGGISHETSFVNVPRDLSTDSIGNCYMAGDVQGYDIDTAGTFQQYFDSANQQRLFGYYAKVGYNSQIISMVENDNQNPNYLDLQVYPVPVNEMLFYQLNSYSGENLEMNLYNGQGQLVTNKKIESSGIYQLDTRALNNGNYYIQITGGGISTGKMFMVSH